MPPPIHVQVRPARNGSFGFVATGPGFYVWEVTYAETVRAAGELASSLRRRRKQPTRANGARSGAARKPSTGD